MLSLEDEEEEEEKKKKEKALPELASTGCCFQISIWEGGRGGEVEMPSRGLASWTPTVMLNAKPQTAT